MCFNQLLKEFLIANLEVRPTITTILNILKYPPPILNKASYGILLEHSSIEIRNCVEIRFKYT
jgi:hypothetical protein